jgi:hypothetical protein
MVTWDGYDPSDPNSGLLEVEALDVGGDPVSYQFLSAANTYLSFTAEGSTTLSFNVTGGSFFILRWLKVVPDAADVNRCRYVDRSSLEMIASFTEGADCALQYTPPTKLFTATIEIYTSNRGLASPMANESEIDWQLFRSRTENVWMPRAPDEAVKFHANGTSGLFGDYFFVTHSLGFAIPLTITTDAQGLVWSRPDETDELVTFGPTLESFKPSQFNPWPFYFSDISGLGSSMAETRGVDLCDTIKAQLPEKLDYSAVVRGSPAPGLLAKKDSAQGAKGSAISYTVRTTTLSREPKLNFTTAHPAFNDEEDFPTHTSPFAALFDMPTALFAYSVAVTLNVVEEVFVPVDVPMNTTNNTVALASDTSGDDDDGRETFFQLTIVIRPLVCSGHARVDIWCVRA